MAPIASRDTTVRSAMRRETALITAIPTRDMSGKETAVGDFRKVADWLRTLGPEAVGASGVRAAAVEWREAMPAVALTVRWIAPAA